MHIVFIHFHLQTGGVTTVIKRQIEALQDRCRVMVITGERPDKAPPCDVVTIPALGYDSTGGISRENPENTAQAIIDAIWEKWPNGCDLIHVHNPFLAKNRQFIKILNALRRKGMRLLLQIHDFAEDGRPSVYFEEPYPEDCHYAVINSRDYGILLDAGLRKEGLHQLFNAVAPLPPTAPTTPSAPFVLYPVRAIRRKNIGEAILWSLFLKNEETLYITLPPNSALDQKPYRRWRAFVESEELNAAFEMGLDHLFDELVASAQSIITTSITEGFGFCFLEPWINHQYLWGRDLGGVTRDFKQRGVTLNHLYDTLKIPVEWIDRQRFKARRRQALSNALAQFKAPDLAEKMEKAFQALETEDYVDFGLLDEALQMEVIAPVADSPKTRARLMGLNPLLAHQHSPGEASGLIRDNRAAILKHYHLDRYRDRLLDIYGQVRRKTVHQRIDKKRLLAAFMNPRGFTLLKWGAVD